MIEDEDRRGSFSFRTAWSRLQVDPNITFFLAPPSPDPLSTQMMNRAFTPTNASVSNVSMPSLSCAVTSQVRIRNAGGHWILESLDIHGKAKHEGGDEYYVTYTDESMSSPTAIAFVSDRQDGSYHLEFVKSPSLNATGPLTGIGSVTIILQYSCGLGHLAPPSKLQWSTGGAINAEYKVEKMTAPHMDNFVPPQGIDLSRYDQVLAFGDSTMGNFANHNRGHSNMYWPGNVWAPLNAQTVDQVFLDQIKGNVTRSYTKFHNVALLLGSSVWDILANDLNQGPQFQDHRASCRRLIASIREEFPSLEIYWKSGTAMHIHRVADMNDWFHLGRVFYMSSSRAHDLYRYQKQIMAEFNVTLLDLYPATHLSADHLRPGDGRHYTQEFDKMMLDWFYPHSKSSDLDSVK
jgi:hypothetical protein